MEGSTITFTGAKGFGAVIGGRHEEAAGPRLPNSTERARFLLGICRIKSQSLVRTLESQRFLV